MENQADCNTIALAFAEQVEVPHETITLEVHPFEDLELDSIGALRMVVDERGSMGRRCSLDVVESTRRQPGQGDA